MISFSLGSSISRPGANYFSRHFSIFLRYVTVSANYPTQATGAVVRFIDFSSWQGLLATLAGLALVTLIGVGARLFMMFTVQSRRERLNRQINERLRTLIASYKVLGGSFTGDLSVDPRHLREIRKDAQAQHEGSIENSDRARRIRDAVEGALSDVILLGTAEHVRLAEQAARELVAGRPVQTDELVVSLRTFIREALDLDAIPAELAIPLQGPARLIQSGKAKERDKPERGTTNTAR